jgi:hypothetical protein
MLPNITQYHKFNGKKIAFVLHVQGSYCPVNRPSLRF